MTGARYTGKPERKSLWPIPWENDMTLCIAALCQDGGERESKGRAVALFDLRFQTEAAGSDVGFKFHGLGKKWCAFLAGKVPVARELLGFYEALLPTRGDDITPLSALDVLRKPLDEFRRTIAERFVREHHAFGYQDFLDHGKEWLPDDVHQRTTLEIEQEQQAIPVELIIIGHIGKKFRVYKMQYGKIAECEGFATIGTGSAVADPWLHYRGQRATALTDRTIYTVFEAYNQAHISRALGVGPHFCICLLDYSEKTGTLEIQFGLEEGRSHLHKLYERFGPRKIEGDILLPGTMWK